MMYRFAAIVGVDPGPFTLGEIAFMAEEKERSAWNHTSSILAMIANVNRDPKRRRKPFIGLDFHPIHAHEQERKKDAGIIRGKFHWLKSLMIDKTIPREMKEAMLDAGIDVHAS